MYFAWIRNIQLRNPIVNACIGSEKKLFACYLVLYAKHLSRYDACTSERHILVLNCSETISICCQLYIFKEQNNNLSLDIRLQTLCIVDARNVQLFVTKMERCRHVGNAILYSKTLYQVHSVSQIFSSGKYLINNDTFVTFLYLKYLTLNSNVLNYVLIDF